MTEPIRLSKYIADLKGCSRREAELYIEGGGVKVNGRAANVSGTKISDRDTVELLPEAKPEPVAPVTILLHKPPGFDADEVGPRPALQLLTPERHAAGDRSGIRTVQRHFVQQPCVTSLETGASGLVVFSQDWRIKRKLQEDAAQIEHEVMVDVAGMVPADALLHLNRAPVIDGRAMLPAKVSMSRSNDNATGLRFAVKGHWPGQIAHLCDTVHLRMTAMKRIRVGRITLSGLEVGQWRYLLPYERF